MTTAMRSALTVLSLSLLYFFSAAPAHADSARCAAIFFSDRLENAIQELSALRVMIDAAQARGDSSPVQNTLRANYVERESQLIDYVQKSQIMTRAQLSKKIKSHIAKIQAKELKEMSQENRAREKHIKQIKHIEHKNAPGTKAVFYEIEPGSAAMGPRGNMTVEITKPFAMMETPTTQIIWRKVALLIAEISQGRYIIEANPSTFKGNTRPVESVSYSEVGRWISALNELSTKDTPELMETFPSHKEGDIYRLPTRSEWEFVLRGRGEFNQHYHFGSDKSELEKYAWYAANSEKKTHPVAQKLPLIFDANIFYDMIGNVHEMTSDYHQVDFHLDGKDPHSTTKSDLKITRGGAWNSSDRDLESGTINGTLENSSGRNDLGFRLVRISK